MVCEDELLDLTNKDIQRMRAKARKELLYSKEEGELLQTNCNEAQGLQMETSWYNLNYHAERLLSLLLTALHSVYI